MGLTCAVIAALHGGSRAVRNLEELAFRFLQTVDFFQLMRNGFVRDGIRFLFVLPGALSGLGLFCGKAFRICLFWRRCKSDLLALRLLFFTLLGVSLILRSLGQRRNRKRGNLLFKPSKFAGSLRYAA